MPIPELERRRAEKLIAEYCDQRVPSHARHQVQLLFRRRGNAFIIIERRPYWLDESQFIDSTIARIAYDGKSHQWWLQYRARSERWRDYTPPKSDRNVEELLAEIDSDPTGIFWG